MGRSIGLILDRGRVVLAGLDPAQGHEQRGRRPCIVVSNPAANGDQRFPIVAVVPLTRTPGEGALYPRLQPGPSGLSATSFALVDQIRAIDKGRVLRTYGRLPDDELEAVDEGLRLYLGLGV